MTNEEKRLINTERALVSLFALIEDSLSEADAYAANKMMGMYFHTNEGLGANFEQTSEVFLHKEDGL